MVRPVLHLMTAFCLLLVQSLHDGAGLVESHLHHHAQDSAPTLDYGPGAAADDASAADQTGTPWPAHAGEAMHCHILAIVTPEMGLSAPVGQGERFAQAPHRAPSRTVDPPVFPPKA
ncbi:hypothetical protein EV659_101383 [Rhodothalassium salexigens DSM 2132]|uniref:Uncharacterized protein n=1 Tax=Rhodothalassium salexigens DSM 2132 TaxID=1188247 RepID=A0A4R2PRL6_RHOSA|nr:hypothetical protein [Rhodothalassium salexigens]MBB4210315.1 hypothetical protein [Rhodothalassium salexigens DSM 2132]MBK1639768.1 hypothetical protein [Rhodothalassium salexigens DSM 2132]TCP38479.1 hypothetical protein EV659_101383 [Rhodothalassium salexigens DSM 2132]